MAASDLAVLQDVKDWLTAGGSGISTVGNPVLSRLITACSGAIYSYLSRQIIIPKTVTERYDGVGNNRVLLRNYPVLSVSNLLVNGTSISAGIYPNGSTAPGWPPSGWVVSPWDGLLPGKPQMLDSFGNQSNVNGTFYGFNPGRQNIQITYTCGYAIQNEAQTVPSAGGVVDIDAPLGPWASDMGVVYASTGIALTPVTASPATGEYIPPTQGSESAESGTGYTFAAGDANEAVLISYGFVPSPINTACIEWVAERYRYSGRIGQRSQTVSGQQTASYDLSAVPAFVKGILDPYRNVVPPYQAWF
jgi:hypothetical protein